MEFWKCDQIILGFIRRKIMCIIGRTFLKKKNYQRNMFLKRLTWMMKWNPFTDSTKYFEQHVAGGGAAGDGSGLQVEVGNTWEVSQVCLLLPHGDREGARSPPGSCVTLEPRSDLHPLGPGKQGGTSILFGGLTSKSCITLIEFYRLQVNHTPAQTPGGRKLGSPRDRGGAGV